MKTSIHARCKVVDEFRGGERRYAARRPTVLEGYLDLFERARLATVVQVVLRFEAGTMPGEGEFIANVLRGAGADPRGAALR